MCLLFKIILYYLNNSLYFRLRNDYYLVDHCFGVVDHVRDQRQLEQLIHAVHYLQSEGVHFGRWNHFKHTSHKRTHTSYNYICYICLFDIQQRTSNMQSETFISEMLTPASWLNVFRRSTKNDVRTHTLHTYTL